MIVGLYIAGAVLLALSMSFKKGPRVRHPFFFILGVACISLAASLQVNRSA